MGRSLRILAAAAVVPCLAAAALAGEPTKKTPQGPVSAIAQKMTGVAGELGKARTGEPVQVQEKAVVGDLDALIAELEKQCAACRGGIKKNNPSRGMADSMISSGTGGIGDLVAPGESAKDWAKLSGRERDRILQSMSEGFPPEYRLVLERYYRRLAEEKAAPSSGDSPQAKPKAEEPKAEKP
jgi:hypothetical protein